MVNASHYKCIVIDQYQYHGFNGCQALCRLEIIRRNDERTVVIATEVKDNPGTSVTNACEHLAYWVCVEFSIDPAKLVWIEHYGYPSAMHPKLPRTYDLVTFRMLPPGHDAVFVEPAWRPMKDADWFELGLEPRRRGQ